MGQDGAITPEQLKRVLEVSRLLAGTDDLDQLLIRIAEACCSILSCERASIFLHDPGRDELWTKVALQSAAEIRVPSHAGIVGHVFKHNSVLHVPDPYHDTRFNPEPDRRTGFVTRNLLAAPMVDLERRPVGVIQAINKSTGAFEPTDSGLIQLLADQAGVAIQRYNLQQRAIEAVALRREMELAKAVQQKLIPASPPKIPGIDCIGWTLPASITGGDCFDLWTTADGRLGILVADATGHGIGPAMVVSQARTLIRALCDRQPDPCALLSLVNSRMADDLDAGQFVTAFLAFLSSDGKLTWCSGGHGPILTSTSGGAPYQVLEPSAPPLGVLPDFMAQRSESMQLTQGGNIVVVSDGIIEAFCASREQFGVQRVIETLTADQSEPLQHMLERLRRAVSQWQGGEEPRDDQTFVIARML